MLIRFVTANYLSFNAETEFNMIAGNYKAHKEHVYQFSKIRLLKAAAIYGANGAGKSNMIRGIEYLQTLVANGVVTKSINDQKFRLDDINNDLPVYFEIEFFKKKIYTYGVSINGTSIIEEFLYESGVDKDDKLVFKRSLVKQKTQITIADKYRKTQKDNLLIELMEDNLLKNNELLISKSSNFKIKEIDTLKDWFARDLIIIFPGSKFVSLVPAISLLSNFRVFANDLLQTFDTGVKELDIETIDFEKFFGNEADDLRSEIIEEIENNVRIVINSPSGHVLVVKEKNKLVVKKAFAVHENNLGQPIKFDLNEESDGTQRLLDFIPAFDRILNEDVTIIIDEIDQSLHPVLLKTLVQKIMQANETKGQFIFSTHESNLLDLEIFRQDEIWFAEKNKTTNQTEFYSLSEYKPRYDLDIRKGYLKGRFGAIPFLASLRDLNWNSHHA